jgi:hypothetical protein
MTRSWSMLMAVPCLLIGLSGSLVRALDVTCGEVVPAGATGDVVSDADCTGASIFLDTGATLRLNGHTISGTDPNPEVCFPFLGECAGVLCRGRKCRVEGPGTIQGFTSGIGGRGVADGDGRVRVIASDLTLRLNSAGISSDRAVVTDVIATDNFGTGIAADKVRARRVDVSRNGVWGISGDKVAGVDVVANLNGSEARLDSAGIRAVRARFRRLTATDNVGEGLRAERAALRESVLSGNTDADISTARPPRVRDTTCEVSSDQVGGDWGVCTLD